ncbi:hypothetical protein PC9H_008958 [Pleurotus ostreatus]|uniref:Uncharacterized protein n=1 Tax=Pleurotus ostreatus TaxID=5322 RepID=A0A8H6ZSA9_PLEOS|nr:uncharacterized protein PC9H_008958 [Pleurotus ostreatus]KAF7426589.1 hypothetical protein PC9H_008958 [Pleurotus ostreatus]
MRRTRPLTWQTPLLKTYQLGTGRKGRVLTLGFWPRRKPRTLAGLDLELIPPAALIVLENPSSSESSSA